MTGVVVIETNLASEADATRLAEALVGAGVAAAANVHGPLRSVYRWRGAVHRAEEWMVALKVAAAREAEAIEAVRAAHPYEKPCILARPVTGGWAPYLDWVRAGGS